MTFVTLVQTQCCNCGVYFGIEQGHCDRLRKQGPKMEHYCPNGHKQWFMEGEADKLRRERDRLQQQLAQRDDEIKRQSKQLVVAKGQITKIQKRAKAGVCPCCNRTVSQLAAHMKTKHPEFDPKVANFDDEKAKRKA